MIILAISTFDKPKIKQGKHICKFIYFPFFLSLRVSIHPNEITRIQIFKNSSQIPAFKIASIRYFIPINSRKLFS